MGTKHKWHKEIKAWADGATIEVRLTNGNDKWGYASTPSWSIDGRVEYRIKPFFKPDIVRYGQFLFEVSERGNVIGTPYVADLWDCIIPNTTNFKVTLADDGNGDYKLKSLEVI